jgi:hypothetical protein
MIKKIVANHLSPLRRLGKGDGGDDGGDEDDQTAAAGYNDAKQ